MVCWLQTAGTAVIMTSRYAEACAVMVAGCAWQTNAQLPDQPSVVQRSALLAAHAPTTSVALQLPPPVAVAAVSRGKFAWQPNVQRQDLLSVVPTSAGPHSSV
jgi:hypothetical protein